tara:strand:- start:2619 stop:3290 length:672 start_codon:yes stop_codon:yes gene_type:complete
MVEERNHMSFKDKKYTVVKSAISKEKSDFIFKYFLLKRKVARYLFDNSYMSPFREDWGMFNDPQVPKTYSHYSDIAMEVLLEEMLPVLKKETELDLVPTYSYARLYKKGDELKRHKDRESCEISTTLNLGGDSWPIFLEPNKNVGISGVDGCTPSSNNPGVKINLEPGDMLIYSGCVLEHWRETFEGEVCGQVFLHYNNIKTSGEEYKFDKRPFLGLPTYYNQ